ncbi:TPA: type IV toxin-antitoxin system YeeU family antitoxin [Klebsiella pneumoniae]|uniref:type IV toxin-antitoxin system YeeU family antitoxin n=1 Tax=Klebsiella pneumoniae TaxID=573 RepID=UPI002FF1850D|nr:type IV toxin-antitoxin system YeeU family antitoxin [Klebsiella pneumoniae]HBR2107593.1 type IV toxin-antitoxin system YeeU family antitoxin [Klebsiella pneumoniae]
MKSTDSENDSFLKWGLNRNVTPCFGARLVQEGNRLHYLADRASITGKFSEADTLGSCGYVYIAVYLTYR